MTADYKSLGLKVGLEIHVQLKTDKKLFCNCSAGMKEKEIVKTIRRRQHPVASELGSVDQAAQYEFLRNRVFNYQVLPREVCLVETDCEPPHDVNQEALRTALQVALMFHSEVPEEIHVMRKTVIDGSNTSGFQRTMIIGMNGWLDYKGRKVEITQVTLEEDAAAIVSEESGTVTYRLNRLGIPLVEIDTGILEGFSPEEVQEIAYSIGLMAKSTGKIRRGIGTIRQDVNVSIRGGDRVEVKGVQELGMLSKVVELEAERQAGLVIEGKSVSRETRAAKEDGSTVFTRPLPGSARMYPESDVLPIAVHDVTIKNLKTTLPEPLDKKVERFKTYFKLSELLAKEISRSDYLNLFEEIMKIFEKSNDKAAIEMHATRMANLLTNLMKNLKREGYQTDNIPDEKLLHIFGTPLVVAKESYESIIKELSSNPNKDVYQIIKELDLGSWDREKFEADVDSIITSLKDKGTELKNNIIMGEIMKKYRGKADGKIIAEIVNKKLQDLITKN